jgi:DNA-directed RNA polymerase specialized sigma subunit
MDRHTFELTVSREIRQALEELLPLQTQAGSISRDNLRRQLQVVSEHVQTAARAYYLEGLVTVDEVADELGVSPEHLSELARQRFAHYGMGRKFGDTWVWTQDEVDVIRPHGE